MVVPMGEDNELIAANTAEQIAKRLTFRPEAINQIKTAIVEACINASEHSFSPDRKIYQRFRVESDRLVITISSRGIVPANLTARRADQKQKKRQKKDAVGDLSSSEHSWMRSSLNGSMTAPVCA
jgi:anti-sigma regulatory factor (Ser/Thr protein kinase)